MGQLRIEGTNQYGERVIEFVPMPIPPLYFWLGADAYPDWPEVSEIVPRARSYKISDYLRSTYQGWL